MAACALLLPLLLLLLALRPATPRTDAPRPHHHAAHSAAAAAKAAHSAAAASSELSPAFFLSSKTPYWAQQLGEREAMPGHCRLVHINHLARHGSRHSTKLKNAQRLHAALRDAAVAGALEPLGRAMLEHVEDFIGEEIDVLGELTVDGRKEHVGQAIRMWHSHSGDLTAALAQGRRLVFEASDKPRTRGSRAAYLEGLITAANLSLPLYLRRQLPALSTVTGAGLGEGGADEEEAEERERAARARRESGGSDSDVDGDDSERPLFDVVVPAECPESSIGHAGFSRLRFFDSCSAYRRYKKDKAWLVRLERYTANATRVTSHERAMLRQLFSAHYVEALAAGQGIGSQHEWLASLSNASPSPAAGGNGSGKHGGRKAQAQQSVNVDAGAGFLPGYELAAGSGVSKRSRKAQGQVRRAMRLLAKAQRESTDGGATPVLPTIAGLAMDFYATCQIDLNANGRNDRFCRVFNGHLELMAKLELITDLGDFYKQGAGDPLAFAASCLLLEDFVTQGDAAALAVSSSPHGAAPAAHFRFGHSETVMPFLSVMGLYQEPGATSLEDYYHAELSAGTSSLLNVTRARLAALRAAHGVPPEAEGDATSTPTPTATIATARTSDRALPPGFSSGLVTALKHPWSGARLVPMAANLQWHLYDCGSGADSDNDDAGPASRMRGMWVKMLHNEREIPFPACSGGASFASLVREDDGAGLDTAASHTASVDGAPFGLKLPCPWDKVKDFYRSTTCSAQDFLKICGEIDTRLCTRQQQHLKENPFF